MPVKILGGYPSITRCRSGLFSLDLALGNPQGELGIPMRTVGEIYGYTNTGKSSLSYFLSAVLTGKGQVTVCDLENADPEYVRTVMENAGMDGGVRLIDSVDAKGKPRLHEDMLGELAVSLSDEEVGATIYDSVGATTPVAEMEAGQEGDLGQAFMGKRAKLVAQIVRQFVSNVRNKERPSVAFIINHVYAVMGGRGHITAGGEAPKNYSAFRLMIWPKETVTVSEEDNTALGFYVNGKVEKLRYGGRGREFGYYIVPGYGVHTGASAMFDCFELGIAERSTTVKLDGKSLGYLKKDLLAYAAEGKQRKFEPFIEKLKEYEQELLTKVVKAEEEPKEKDVTKVRKPKAPKTG